MFELLISLICSYNFCEGNDRGYFYNLTQLSVESSTHSIPVDENKIFYFALCRELTSNDIGMDVDVSGYSVVSVNPKVNRVDLLIPFSALRLKNNDIDNPEYALKYFASSEPIFLNNTYSYILNFEWYFICDNSFNGTDPDYEPLYAIGRNLEVLYLFSASSFGCPIKIDTPTPTPQFDVPDTKFVFRDPDEIGQGIQLNLIDLNQEYFGIYMHMKVNNENQYRKLFYQPAERIECPVNKCDSDYSSAWLCDYNMTYCDSYGVIDSHIDLTVANENNIEEGVILAHKTRDGKQVQNTIKCTSFVPEGHFSFSPNAKLDSNILTINSETIHVCPHEIEDPLIDDGNCIYEMDPSSGYSYKINLSILNKGQTGWNQSVQLIGAPTFQGTLIYQPCGYTRCPSLTNCDGDENAYVWFCFDREDKKVCDGFGLFEYPIDIYRNDVGVTIEYHGDQQRVAIVDIECNTSLPSDQLNIVPTALLDNTFLHLRAQTSYVCSNSTPTPLPTFTPDIPFPEPSIIPNPYIEHIVFHSNDTHYIIFDLNKTSSQFHHRQTFLTDQNSRIPFFYNFSYWNLIEVPDGYDNPHKLDLATIWGCWNYQGKDSCFSIGDRRISVHGDGYENNDLEKGIRITYRGANQVNTFVQVTCESLAPSGLIDFSSSEVGYLQDETGIQFKLRGLGKFACPRLYSTYLPPPVSNTPTPNPQPSIQFSIESNSNGKIVSLDLASLESHSAHVILIYPDYAERPKIFLSPSILSSCPSGYNCSISKTANVWKCFDKFQGETNSCYPMGDFSYGLNLSLTFPNTRDENIPSSIHAHYDGGVYQSSTIVEFRCNELLNDNEIRFGPLYEQRNNSTTMRIDAYIKSVCPHDPSSTNSSSTNSSSKISGGLIFCIILVFGILVYVVGGMVFNYVKNKTISFPNVEFWYEAGRNIEAGALFIFSCGKRVDPKSIRYAEI